MLASVVIKLIALTHILWAGLAFGVVLRPADYVFLLVFLGFRIILTRFARILGGSDVADVLDRAERTGSDSGDLEGNRYIQISDTLIRILSAALKEMDKN